MMTTTMIMKIVEVTMVTVTLMMIKLVLIPC